MRKSPAPLVGSHIRPLLLIPRFVLRSTVRLLFLLIFSVATGVCSATCLSSRQFSPRRAVGFCELSAGGELASRVCFLSRFPRQGTQWPGGLSVASVYTAPRSCLPIPLKWRLADCGVCRVTESVSELRGSRSSLGRSCASTRCFGVERLAASGESRRVDGSSELEFLHSLMIRVFELSLRIERVLRPVRSATEGVGSASFYAASAESSRSETSIDSHCSPTCLCNSLRLSLFEKPDGSLLSAVDVAVQAVVLRALKARFPDDSVLAEEAVDILPLQRKTLSAGRLPQACWPSFPAARRGKFERLGPLKCRTQTAAALQLQSPLSGQRTEAPAIRRVSLASERGKEELLREVSALLQRIAPEELVAVRRLGGSSLPTEVQETETETPFSEKDWRPLARGLALLFCKRNASDEWFDAEKQQRPEGQRRCWVVDPIDGSLGVFNLGGNGFSTAVALVNAEFPVRRKRKNARPSLPFAQDASADGKDDFARYGGSRASSRDPSEEVAEVTRRPSPRVAVASICCPRYDLWKTRESELLPSDLHPAALGGCVLSACNSRPARLTIREASAPGRWLHFERGLNKSGAFRRVSFPKNPGDSPPPCEARKPRRRRESEDLFLWTMSAPDFPNCKAKLEQALKKLFQEEGGAPCGRKGENLRWSGQRLVPVRCGFVIKYLAVALRHLDAFLLLPRSHSGKRLRPLLSCRRWPC